MLLTEGFLYLKKRFCCQKNIFYSFEKTFIFFDETIFLYFDIFDFIWRNFIWQNFIWCNFIWQTSFGKTLFDETSFGKTSFGELSKHVTSMQLPNIVCSLVFFYFTFVNLTNITRLKFSMIIQYDFLFRHYLQI